MDWVTPGALDLRRSDNVVVSVFERTVLTPDVSVDKPELLAIVCETRCPNSAAVGLASHVKLGLSVEWADGKIPVCQILRVMDLNTRIPFESRCGDVVVFADPQDGRVGIEAWEDWVPDLRHNDEELWKISMDQKASTLPRIYDIAQKYGSCCLFSSHG